MTDEAPEERQSTTIPLTGLWKNESKNGRVYYSGSIGLAKVLLFENTQREEGANQPHFNLVLGTKAKAKEENPNPGQNESVSQAEPQAVEANTSDIPF